jgi:hypothetical protein
MGEDHYGNPMVDFNDHAFQITKAKHGASIRAGEFQMIINPDKDDLMPQGTFDDAKTVLTFAKRFGLLAGSGGRYRLPIVAGEQEFAKHEDICVWLRENEMASHTLRASLIAIQRHTKGLPMIPQDGYLCHPDVEVPVAMLLQLLEGNNP